MGREEGENERILTLVSVDLGWTKKYPLYILIFSQKPFTISLSCIIHQSPSLISVLSTSYI